MLEQAADFRAESDVLYDLLALKYIRQSNLMTFRNFISTL